MSCDHNHFDIWTGFLELTQNFQSACTRQPQIEQDYVNVVSVYDAQSVLR